MNHLTMTLEHKMLFDSLDPNSGYLFVRDLLNFAFDGVIPEPESEAFRKIRLEIQERENSRLRKARSRLRKAGKPVDPVPAPVVPIPAPAVPIQLDPVVPVPKPQTDEKKIKSRAFDRIWNLYPKKQEWFLRNGRFSPHSTGRPTRVTPRRRSLNCLSPRLNSIRK